LTADLNFLPQSFNAWPGKGFGVLRREKERLAEDGTCYSLITALHRLRKSHNFGS